ncbi:hypothetical protein F5148DRAFT_1174272 [Russula earlei]|uniref:Uncharacterized protein n=1 Tax=Russula earlei TaxID=71964 RepID=A0ACC0UHC7_9AGAM|nr:hypothetical protein F5148DRAFT_1174272 [Russula earlei]
MASHSSKHHHSPSFVSSPPWSLNTLTGTTASGSGGLPVTPVLSPVSLPSPPGSARSTSTYSGHTHVYAPPFPSTPGAPHMGTVPLPPHLHHQHSLPTPPVSPERSRYAVLSELLVYTGHRPAQLSFNVVQPPSAARLHPACSPNAMNEPAISTHAPFLLLEVPGVSGGSFYASSARGHAVTVGEVLHALHAKLSERASQTDYNQLPTENHRRAASSSFSQRNRAVPDPAGLRRFDLLGGRTTFSGLQRAANGADVWHVYFI